MNKPRLLVAVDSYLPRWDGIARTLSETLPHMTSHYEIRLIIPNYPGVRPDIDGVEFITLPLIPFLRSGDLRFPMVLPWVIHTQIAWADILWTHTAVSIGGSCIRVARSKGIPIVSMIHSTEWVVYGKGALFSERITQWLWLRIARKRYAAAVRLLTPGPTTKEELVENKFESPIEITPLGVSLTQFQPLPEHQLAQHRQSLGLPTDKPIIGYVGRFGGEKNLATLIEANRIIAEKTGAHLVLVGGTRAELDGINIGKNVTIVSPTMSPERYYQALDIYVLPSLTESFALGILEAMACGIAPVTTPVGAMPTFIESGKNGILFPKENINALAAALETLIADDGKRRMIAAQARETVEQDYTWEQAAKRICAHLDDVLKETKR